MVMSEKINLQLGELQRSLLIPLWGRAQEYKSDQSLLRDKFAFEIIEKLNFDFDSIAKQQPKQTTYTSALRAYHIDNILRKIIEDHNDITVVNIGAGLDTTFQRVDNGKIFWYDLDLPDTIELRKKLIPESERNVYIAKSFLDKTWYNDIRERRSKIVFISAGVFPYFKKEEIKSLFMDLIKAFPGSDMIFETMGKIMIWTGNYLRRKRGQDSAFSSFIHGGISSANVAGKWTNKIKIIDDFPVYAQVKEHFNHKMAFQIRIMNFFKLYQIVHLSFE
jgi:O-methyltransferase involved in polyketide biosynthesis